MKAIFCALAKVQPLIGVEEGGIKREHRKGKNSQSERHGNSEVKHHAKSNPVVVGLPLCIKAPYSACSFWGRSEVVGEEHEWREPLKQH